MKRSTTLFIMGLMLIVSCKAKLNNSNAGYYSYKTECIGVELDGSETLKSWGKGSTKADAIEQAYKNAINDVLFNGINNGSSECNLKPLLPAVNIKEKNDTYFNKFFTDSGGYKTFISNKDGSTYKLEASKLKKLPGSQFTYSIIVRVLRVELKQKMISEGILKTN